MTIFWFRRDLRLEDNRGLFEALQSGRPVQPIFIFDPHILDRLEDKKDRRVEFIYQQLVAIDEQLEKMGSNLQVFYGAPLVVFKNLLRSKGVSAVYANHDYEPYAIERDAEVERFLHEKKVPLKTFKDQVIFERHDVLKEAGGPYTVFTPYSRKWKALLKPGLLEPKAIAPDVNRFAKASARQWVTLQDIGFQATGQPVPSAILDSTLLKNYASRRDFPALNGTSHMGLHLRFGTVSVRSCVRQAQKFSEVWLNELIWREFFMQILFHYPKVVGAPFRNEYDRIQWRTNKTEFARWCAGETGYPLVDAGMRELNETGYMHNRVRMVTASFLTKHLLIDWRWGEEYFARRLLDFDLAANNGNWQWVAGCGCDAAPYFRVFNPELQAQKFDKTHEYVRRWVPEWQSSRYPRPIVEHTVARARALEAYSVVKGAAKT